MGSKKKLSFKKDDFIYRNYEGVIFVEYDENDENAKAQIFGTRKLNKLLKNKVIMYDRTQWGTDFFIALQDYNEE